MTRPTIHYGLDYYIAVDPQALDLWEQYSMSSCAEVGRVSESRPRPEPGAFGRSRVAAAVIAIGIGVFITSSRPPAALTPLDRPTAFWMAVSDGDRETAIEYLDPGQSKMGA